MAFELGQAARDAGYRVAGHDVLEGSTNEVAQAAARDGEAGPLWVVTGHQIGGRGRLGRKWQGYKGNLAASLMLRTDRPAQELATLGFVAGLSLTDALEKLAPPDARHPITLKWPNDVMADGCKFVGILLESGARADGSPAIVVGIGVNIARAPDGTPYPATCLSDIGWTVDAEAVFAALADAWVGRYDKWCASGGFAAIRNDWLARAAGVGGPVSVTLGSQRVTGVFETLDDSGRLIVLKSDGTRFPVSAGDVHFGAAATMPAAG